MPRPPGTRNADYEESRKALLSSLSSRLTDLDGSTVSLRQLAEAAGVSLPTLRHYFGDRGGVIRAVLAHQRELGAVFARQLVDAPLLPLGDSMRNALDFLIDGWLIYGAGDAHILGLRAGLGQDDLGPAYLRDIFEPSLEAFERRLSRHAAAGHLRPCDLHVAALSLLSPVLLALLHQCNLGGRDVRPLDWDAFLDQHVKFWLIAHAAQDSTPARRAR